MQHLLISGHFTLLSNDVLHFKSVVLILTLFGVFVHGFQNLFLKISLLV